MKKISFEITAEKVKAAYLLYQGKNITPKEAEDFLDADEGEILGRMEEAGLKALVDAVRDDM